MDEIYEYLNDWDDDTLSGYAWEQQLLEAAHVYYESHPNRYRMRDKNIISNYKSWKREKYAPEQ